MHPVFGRQPGYWGYTPFSVKNDKKAVDGDQTDGCRYLTHGLWSKG